MVSEDAPKNTLCIGQGQVNEFTTELRDVVWPVSHSTPNSRLPMKQ